MKYFGLKLDLWADTERELEEEENNLLRGGKDSLLCASIFFLHIFIEITYIASVRMVNTSQ